MGDAEELRAANVIEALCRVMRDLPAIGKEGKADPKQGGYAYRGIEQITPHTQKLFAKHGIVFTPHVRSWEIRELAINNKPWMDVVTEVEYTVYGPGGIDDKITIGPLLAIGRDNSDKGGNKCLTQAYKYALLQALSVSDPKDDADGQTHEADERPTVPAVPAKEAQNKVLTAAEGDTGIAGQAWRKADISDRPHVPQNLLDEAVAEAKRLVAEAGAPKSEPEPEQPELLPDNGKKATDEARQAMQPKGEGT